MYLQQFPLRWNTESLIETSNLKLKGGITIRITHQLTDLSLKKSLHRLTEFYLQMGTCYSSRKQLFITYFIESI